MKERNIRGSFIVKIKTVTFESYRLDETFMKLKEVKYNS